MNVRLQKLFTQYNISEKDRYEILQIYEFLSPKKRQNVIDNFPTIIANLQKVNEDIEREQEILLGETLENIQIQVKKLKKNRVSTGTRDILLEFKETL